jgi:transcriptional regulator with GAF, ATPase, and Fis domain
MATAKSLTLITRNPAMRAMLESIDQVVDSDSSILLIGETGVGKELIAEYIHRTSPRGEQPFVKVALSALPSELLESELFGHQKGAFTSASSEKKGLFELADTGSIFLDDIDDSPVNLQSKLLRVLESRELMRIGGQTSIPVNVRLITASKIDLKELVERHLFRADLFYRINVVPVTIPPLRERQEDVPLLISYYMERFAPGKDIKISQDALRALMHYPWPGNVRELRNVIQRVALFAKEEVKIQDLPAEIRDQNPMEYILKACNRCFVDQNMSFDQITACLETNLLRQALQQSQGNRTNAAKLLGMNLSTLRDKLKKYSIE